MHYYLLPACRLIVLTRRWRRLRRLLPHRFGHRYRQMGAYGRGCLTAMERNFVWRQSWLWSARLVRGLYSRPLYHRTHVQITNLDDEAREPSQFSGGACAWKRVLGY